MLNNLFYLWLGGYVAFLSMSRSVDDDRNPVPWSLMTASKAMIGACFWPFLMVMMLVDDHVEI